MPRLSKAADDERCVKIWNSNSRSGGKAAFVAKAGKFELCETARGARIRTENGGASPIIFRRSTARSGG
jgi:hypothetical protein